MMATTITIRRIVNATDNPQSFDPAVTIRPLGMGNDLVLIG